MATITRAFDAGEIGHADRTGLNGVLRRPVQGGGQPELGCVVIATAWRARRFWMEVPNL